MNTKRVDVAGRKIAYARDGSGQPLILIHGYPLDHTIWVSVTSLLKSDFDVILPDMRGFGQSDIPRTSCTILDYASDIAGLMDQVKIPNAIIAGHSMGGYVALTFAKAFPSKLGGLGLISSQTLPDTVERRKSRYATAKQLLATGVTSIAEEFPNKLTGKSDLQVQLKEIIARQNPVALYNALHAMAERSDSTETLRSLTVPVVVVHGGADRLIPVDRSREMKALQANARYVELPEVGHMPMMEKPVAVAEAIRFFKNDAKRA